MPQCRRWGGGAWSSQGVGTGTATTGPGTTPGSTPTAAQQTCFIESALNGAAFAVVPVPAAATKAPPGVLGPNAPNVVLLSECVLGNFNFVTTLTTLILCFVLLLCCCG